MTKELSPAEYKEMVSTGNTTTQPNLSFIKYGAVVVVALVLCGVSFGAGVNYQKGKTSTKTNANSMSRAFSPGGGAGGFGGQGGFRNGQRPIIGKVTAISSDSITINNSRTGSNQTFKIASSTTVQNNGATASVSDIKTDDTVLIIADSADSTTASQILLNPSLGLPQGSAQSSTMPDSMGTSLQ